MGLVALWEKELKLDPKLDYTDPQFEQPMRCVCVCVCVRGACFMWSVTDSALQRRKRSALLPQEMLRAPRGPASSGDEPAGAGWRSVSHPLPASPPEKKTPRSIWGQFIPYFLLGASEAFTNVGAPTARPLPSPPQWLLLPGWFERPAVAAGGPHPHPHSHLHWGARAHPTP